VTTSIEDQKKKIAAAILHGDPTRDQNAPSAIIEDVKRLIDAADIPSIMGMADRLARLDLVSYSKVKYEIKGKFAADISMKDLDNVVNACRIRGTETNMPTSGGMPDQGKWQRDLQLTDALKPLATYQNMALFLENHTEWKGVLAYNELTAGVDCRRDPPDPITVHAGVEIEDHFDIEATRYFERHGMLVKPQAVCCVVDSIARKNTYHPVREYLTGLKWDGTPRLKTWLIDYCGVSSSDADPNNYAMAVGEAFLVSAVARVFQPGCKVQHTLVLEGAQGCGKSTTVEILGQPWWTDQLDDFGSKDASMQLRGAWVIELSELDNLSRADMSRVKSFLTRQTERFRVPYGRRLTAVPRQCVFIGTTNQSDWLRDETGGRRFWPVKCGKRMNTDDLARDRDQIWAEAFHQYKAGVPWHLTDPGLRSVAEEEAKSRYLEDPWQPMIIKAAEEVSDSKGSASLTEILHQFGLDRQKMDQAAANRAARCLKVAGWEQFRKRASGGIVERRYREAKPQLPLGEY
jgi:putative DNA primase/helicase